MLEQLTGNSKDGSVTVVISDHVRPGKGQEFERWVTGISEELEKSGGIIGHTTVQASGYAHPEYVTVLRFASVDDLCRWEESPQLEEWLERREGITIGGPTFHSQNGMVTWFTLPGHHVVVPPPNYKMALVAYVGISVLLLSVLPILGLLFGSQPYLAAPIRFTLQFVTSILFSALILTFLMTWVVMPLLTWLTRRWLFPDLSKGSDGEGSERDDQSSTNSLGSGR